jgi:hypothetical protein
LRHVKEGATQTGQTAEERPAMQTALILLVASVLVLASVALIASAQLSVRINALRADLRKAPGPVDVAARLPAKVRDFALRADANPADLAHRIAFTQEAEMQLKRGAPWQPLCARQTVAIGAPGFLWLADQPLGPIAKFRVIDAFTGGRGLLQVMLLGLVRIARITGSEADRAEAMRYLAELPWAPDAILGNPSLRWTMLDDDWAEVSLAEPWVAVRFRFDAQGDIAEMRARDRPATDPSGKPVTHDWQGYFRDYRMIGPRRIPAEGEVGYLYPDGYRPYFQGRITEYSATH